MGVAADEVVTVIDLNHITILRMEGRKHDHAARCCLYVGAFFGHEVHTFMERIEASERIDAPTIGR